jgi:hypothetical protein
MEACSVVPSSAALWPPDKGWVSGARRGTASAATSAAQTLWWFGRRSNALRPGTTVPQGLSDRGSPKASPPARDVDYQVHDEHDRGEQVPPVER